MITNEHFNYSTNRTMLGLWVEIVGVSNPGEGVVTTSARSRRTQIRCPLGHLINARSATTKNTITAPMLIAAMSPGERVSDSGSVYIKS